MKYEFEFTQSEYTDLTNPNVSDKEKLEIYERKFNFTTKNKKLMDLLNDLHIRFMDFCSYVAGKCEDGDLEKLMVAYKDEFIDVEHDLKYYLQEIINKGLDNNASIVKSNIFVIQNRIRRTYDKAEPFFCDKGIAFVDINEKRVGIDNCIDTIVSDFIMCFSTDQDILEVKFN